MNITPVSTPVTVVLPKLSEADQKKFDQVKQNLQSALQTLKSSKKSNDASAQRKAQTKAMAQQRIAQIKQAIKSLRQFHGLDPKAAARMVAQLSKQLAQAVKDYQSAGGNDASVASADTGSAAAPAATDDTKTPQSSAASAYAQTQQITVSAGRDDDKAFLNAANEVKNDLRRFARQLKSSLKSRFMPESMNPDLKDAVSAERSLDEVDRILTTLGKA